LFAFLRVIGLFLRSEAPGLVFSATYLRGKLAPSAFPVLTNGFDRDLEFIFCAYGEDRAAASPTDKSRKERRPPTSHFRKTP
jgi:hypothetical protein